ncbi:MAG TPA: hypothetical protein VGM53_04050 [Streptosporangiaceae bacterium]
MTASRGCAATQARVAREVWLDPLSMIRWMRRCGGVAWSSMARNRVNVWELLRWMRSAMTSPVVTFMAAMMETVPCRAYSNSRRASRPGRPGIWGCLRDLAWMPVFSSTLIRTVPGGGFRYRRQTCPALAQKEGSSARLSQPRTLCGRTLAPASTRPTVAGEIARLRSPRRAAIIACDHCDSPSGGTEVATATTASRALGPWVCGRPDLGLSNKPAIPRTANRRRQVRTTATLQPRSRAIAAFAAPAAAASTILARSTSRCGLVPAARICSSLRRRLTVSSTGTARARPATGISFRITVITEECRHNRRGGGITGRRAASRGPGAAIAAGGRH